MPAGTISVTVTLLAPVNPRPTFVTARSNSRAVVPPLSLEIGPPVLVIPRSIGFDTVAHQLLLLKSESCRVDTAVNPTVEQFLNVPANGAVAVMLIGDNAAALKIGPAPI